MEQFYSYIVQYGSYQPHLKYGWSFWRSKFYFKLFTEFLIIQ